MSDSRFKGFSGQSAGRASILSALVASLFAGTMVVLLSTSFAALIFSGEMSVYIPRGIALVMSAAIIVGLGMALFSHCSPSISMADEDTAPLYALLASLVVAALPAGTAPEQLFASALAAILLSTVVAGFGLALLGVFRFGRLVQYLPYSVMGGYFAAVGWLLLVGGLKVASGNGSDFAFTDLELNWTVMLSRSLPLILVVVWLLFMHRRVSRSLLLPGTVAIAVPVWFLAALAWGRSPQDLMLDGALIGPFAGGSTHLFHPLNSLEFADINWWAVFSNIGVIGAIFLLSVLSMVLSVSGLGLLTREELDLDRELKIAGLSNVISGLGGGMTGLPSYSLSSLAMDMGAPKNQWVGVFTVIFCAVVFIFGFDIVAYTPRFVLGALLVYLGIILLYEWLFEAWYKFSSVDYLVIPTILLTAIFKGFLTGIFVGFAAAVILFVLKYSRSKVIRFLASGTEMKSNVDRDPAAEREINRSGDRVLIVGLQGYLFFGTAGHVYDALAERAKDVGRDLLAYAILDFSQVTGLDASAALNFQRMTLLASKAGFRLIIAGLDSQLLERLVKGGFDEGYEDNVIVRADLDRAVEWCEEDLLSNSEMGDEPESCFDRFRPFLSSDQELETFKSFLEMRRVEAQTELTRQGDESRELFFIETGAASAFIKDTSGDEHRVRRTRQGTVYGEMGFYLGNPRTATVIVDDPGVVYILSLDSLARLEEGHPEIAGALHRYMAMLTCERLRYTTRTLRAVLL